MCSICDTLQNVYEQVRQNLGLAVSVQKRQYNKKAFDRKFKVGDGVWHYNPRRKKGKCPKLDIPWDGPYFVTHILGNVVYGIRMNRRSKSKIVHVDKLAPVRGEVDGEWVFKLPKKLKEYDV